MNNGKICISVCAETADDLIEQIKRADELADVIEIRFDCLQNEELNLFVANLQKVKLITDKPLMATLRHKWGGRDFVPNYLDTIFLWERFLQYNVFDYADFEGEWKVMVQDALTSRTGISSGFSDDFVKKLRQLQTIFSYHNFKETLKEDIYYNFYTPIINYNPHIIKIATQGEDVTDGIPFFDLLQNVVKTVKFIPILMGESGKWTRILGLAHGAFMTYAALDSGKETAPGQISAKDLTEVYRVKDLDENTEIYGIIGGNTAYSMSPYIHNAAFKFHGLNAVFVPLQMQNLDEFIKRMVKPETREIELNFKGFAVTIPHKQAIIKHLDFLDESAEKIGAVNTVKIKDGKLYGYNTDAHGFIEPLKNAYGDLKDTKIAVIGAGGAARACIYALKTEGAKVTIFARHTEKAKNLAEEFQIDLQQLSTQHSALSTYDIVVNATPLGTKGELEWETPATSEQLKNIQLAYDLVYNPFETRFLREAKSADVPTIGGMAMLIAQAIEQQKIWTGLDAPMKEMSQAALQKLE